MSLEGMTFDDVLLKPQHGVLDRRKDADISTIVGDTNLRIPIFSAPMPSVASKSLLDKLAWLGGAPVINRVGEGKDRSTEEMIADYYSISYYKNSAFVAVGLQTDIALFCEANIFKFVLDVAHAHTDKVLRFIENTKTLHPEIILVAGSVATAEGAYELLEAGADALRVGIGPGSACTTRSVTGFGVPQLQAIEECAHVAEHKPVIADGGIRGSADVVKSLAAGADAVMIGGLFARSIEAGGLSHYGNASEKINGHRAPEGIEITFEEPPEPLENIVKRLTWGLRSGISYAGATNIEELQCSPQWIKLTDAGRSESKLV